MAIQFSGGTGGPAVLMRSIRAVVGNVHTQVSLQTLQNVLQTTSKLDLCLRCDPGERAWGPSCGYRMSSECYVSL